MSADGLPGPVGLLAGLADHGLWPAADVNRAFVFAALHAGIAIGLARLDIAVMAVLLIAPAPLLFIFEGGVLGFGGHPTIILVHIFADLVADDATNNRAADRCEGLPGTVSELIADNATRDSADHCAGVLI